MEHRSHKFDGLVTNLFSLLEGLAHLPRLESLALLPRLDDLDLELSLPEIEHDLKSSDSRGPRSAP